MEISEDENIRLLRQNKYEELEWSNEELAIRYMRSRKEHLYSTYTLSFSGAIILKFRKSIFGPYLDILNHQQIQDESLNENKLIITDYDLSMLHGKEKKIFDDNNSVFEDAIGMLKTVINNQGVVDYQCLRKTIDFLRISDFYMNRTDRELRKFKNLQVLVLSGNNLREIDGSFLPRRLKCLELYDNFIHDIITLAEGAPQYLLHLGLGRNRLDDNEPGIRSCLMTALH